MGRFWLAALVIAGATFGVAPRVQAQAEPTAPPPNCFTDPTPPSGPEFAPDPPPPPSEYRPRWELTAEAVFFLFRRPEPRFPLATLGDVANPVPGALGQPGTRVLADGSTFTENLHIGTRVTGTLWLTDEPEALGVQASGFIMEQANSSFNQGNAGGAADPVLARPYFNVVLGREDADPRAVPATMAGNVNLAFTTRLMGADASLIYNLTGHSTYGPSLFALVGPRWLKLDERYSSNETSTDLPPLPANTFVIQDRFTTYNQFYGGQIGTQFRYRWEGVTFDLISKVAAGNNYETLQINGFTSVTNQATGKTVAGQQGLFAQPSNIGRYTHNSFSVIPELALKLKVDLTQSIKVTLGYGFLSMTHAARPAENLDRNINIQPLGAPGQVGPAFPMRPTSIAETNFWTHTFSLGLELVF
jgi:hypothetical protein